MKSTRREWLSFTGLGALASMAFRRQAAAQDVPSPSTVRRIAAVIAEYEAQGFHRTATAVDDASGAWLADQVRQAGLHAALEPFRVNRVDLMTCALIVANRRIEGIPLFDGSFTPA